MKKRKNLIIIGAILMSLTFSVGCSSRSTGISSSRSTGVNRVDLNTIDKLPEDQKNKELDKELARIRTARKESHQVKDGTESVFSENGGNIPGQSRNIPNFADEGYEKMEEYVRFIRGYIENELKIPKRPVYGYDTSPCVDPRMNSIYDDEDKGVASGYDNENIRIEEYETEKDDVYSYLILVRDSKDSPWKVIHNGNSYKE